MLTHILNSHTRAVILTRLFTPDTPKFHLRQLARDGGLSAPGLLKELTHLHELRLVCKEENNGHIRNYQYRKATIQLPHKNSKAKYLLLTVTMTTSIFLLAIFQCRRIFVNPKETVKSQKIPRTAPRHVESTLSVRLRRANGLRKKE